MKFKILILFVSILLVGTAISKDVEVKAKWIEEGFLPSDQIAFDQTVRRNFLVSALCGFPSVNNSIQAVMTKSQSYNLVHNLQYYSDANKNIRVYVLVTGPEFAEYISNRGSVKSNTWYTFQLNWMDTWKTGVYKVTFVIEVIGGKGGTTLTESYSFIVY
jgi:hypothetical protein